MFYTILLQSPLMLGHHAGNTVHVLRQRRASAFKLIRKQPLALGSSQHVMPSGWMPRAIRRTYKGEDIMKYQNTHSIRGYVGQDAKTTKLENDRQVTNFSVATKTFWKENGEDKSRTEWHRVVVWGNLSKKVAENLKKGQPVLVEGEIRTREYTKQVEAGKKKIDVKTSITELFASTVLVFATQESNDADQADEAPASEDGVPF